MDAVERRLEGRNDLVILERRAGHDEAYEGRPLRLALLLVELLRVPRDLQEPDSLVDVVLVGLLVTLDTAPDLRLFLAPRRDVAAVKRFLDLSVQLVQVNLVDAVL